MLAVSLALAFPTELSVPRPLHVRWRDKIVREAEGVAETDVWHVDATIASSSGAVGWTEVRRFQHTLIEGDKIPGPPSAEPEKRARAFTFNGQTVNKCGTLGREEHRLQRVDEPFYLGSGNRKAWDRTWPSLFGAPGASAQFRLAGTSEVQGRTLQRVGVSFNEEPTVGLTPIRIEGEFGVDVETGLPLGWDLSFQNMPLPGGMESYRSRRTLLSVRR